MLCELFWLFAPRILSDLDEILMSFWPFEHPFLDWRLRIFQCLDLIETGVYRKPALSTFQRNWPCTILTFVQETAASKSRVVGLIYAFRMVFSNFPVRIPVSSEMLLTNRKNLVVDEVALLENAFAFLKLMVRIGTTLCAKVVRRIAVVGNFPALWLIFVIFPAFGWPSSWCRI